MQPSTDTAAQQLSVAKDLSDRARAGENPAGCSNLPGIPDGKRWFVSKYIVQIKRKKFNPQDLAYGHGQYFDSWADAHAHLVQRSGEAVKKAQARFNSEIRAFKKAQKLIDPTFKV